MSIISSYKLVSFNVNGIRAAAKKGVLDWIVKEDPDILGIQETKSHKHQLSEDIISPAKYHSYWHSAERKGYSGVALYTKKEPLSLIYGGMSDDELSKEGRVLVAEYPEFLFLTVYFPNGKMNKDRLDFKMRFYERFQEYCEELKENYKKPLVVCGDVNTAHKAIDLARPKANEKISGFLIEEREWIDRYLDSGFTDIFRELDESPDKYTWWSLRSRARDRNVGWRIDYFYISNELRKNVKSAGILSDVVYSDHCPISLELEF